MALRYVAHAYCLIEPPHQIWTQYDLRQKSYKSKMYLTQTQTCKLRLIDSLDSQKQSTLDFKHKLNSADEFYTPVKFKASPP